MAQPRRTEVHDDSHDAAIVEVASSEQTRIGRYELRYHVASGGMASVFLARAVGPAGFTRPVALKRMHPHLARRREFALMFLDEARIAARINHPNVCAIHDFGEADGAYFIAMEYLAGVPLIRLMNALLREERAGRPRSDDPRWHALAARIVADAAAGLHAAHEAKDDAGAPLLVVHRDVSPQNLFVTFDGAVKVVDFGIALARDRFQETETGTLKGKLGYMAPEQAAATPVDRRADVWALGVCLWELLVGARLFHRNSPMETLKAVGEAAIPAPSSRRPSVPAQLDAIVMRALSRAPEDRHATARELARELEAYVRSSGEPTGLSDLAEWMAPLFAEERAQKSEIVHTLLHGPDVSTELRVKGASRTATDAGRAPEEMGRDETSAERAVEKRGRGGGVTASMPGVSSPPLAELETAPVLAKPEPPTVKVDALPFDALPLDDAPSPRAGRSPWIAAAIAVGAVGLLMGVVVVWDGAVTPPQAPPSALAGVVSTPPPVSGIPVVEGPPPSATPAPVPSAPEAPPEPPSSITPSITASTAASTSPGAGPRARRERARLSSSVAPAPAPAAPALGWVSIATVGGWGEVWEGNRRLGQTPLRVQLSSGAHVLRIVPADGAERRATVTVLAGETSRVVVPLQ